MLRRLLRRGLWLIPVALVLTAGKGRWQTDRYTGVSSTPTTATVTTFSSSFAGNYQTFQDTANTVCHVSFTGSALTDSKSCAWTQVGTVPQVASPGFFTTDFSTPQPGAGPFSASNYYRSTNPSDSTDFTGDFTMCFAWWQMGDNLAYNCIYNNGNNSNSGYAVCVNGGRTLEFFQYSSGGQTSVNTGGISAAPQNSLQVGCVGRSGSTIYVRLGNNATKSGAMVSPWVAGTSNTAKIGTRDDGGLVTKGYLVEAWFSTDAWSETAVTAKINRALRLIPETGSTLTLSRPSTKPLPQLVATSPQYMTYTENAPLITDNGLVVTEFLRNGGTNPNDMQAWTATNATVTADSAVSPDQRQYADTVTSTVNGGYIQQPNWTSVDNGIHVASVYAKTTSGTQAYTMTLRDTTSSTDLCTANCTATTSWPNSPARCWCASTSVTGGHTLAIKLYPGGTSGTGTIVAWGGGISPTLSNGTYNTPFNNSQFEGTAYQELWNMPMAGKIDTTLGAGSFTITPMWSSSNAGTDRYIFLSAPFRGSTADGIALQYLVSTSKWRLSVGNVTVDSAAQSFAAETAINMSWRYSKGGNACLTVGAAAEVCSASTVGNFTSENSLLFGDASGGKTGFAIKNFIIKAGTQPSQSVSFLGDSITYGTGAADATSGSYPARVGGLRAPAMMVSNYGHSGDTAANCLTTWRNYIKAYTNQLPTKLVVLCGVNDIRAGSTAASIFTTLSTIYSEAAAAGITVIPATLLPAKNSAGMTAGMVTQLNTLNTSIRGAGYSYIDFWAVMGDTDPDALKASWTADGLHPNDLGYAQMATTASAGL